MTSPSPSPSSSSPLITSITLHPALTYLESLGSDKSRKTMRSSLNIAVRILTKKKNSDIYDIQWHTLTYQETAALQAALMRKYKPATAQRIMCAVKRTLKEAWRLKLMTLEAYTRAIDIPSIRIPENFPGRALELEEIRALIEACENDKNRVRGHRDRALIVLLRASGLRCAEISHLKTVHFEPKNSRLKVYKAKGGDSYYSYLPQSSIPPIEEWLDIRDRRPGALINPVRREGTIAHNKHLTESGIFQAIRKRCKQIELQHFSPQDFRRTFCTDLIGKIDDALLQKLMHHKSFSTTARYDRRKESVQAEAVQNIEF